MIDAGMIQDPVGQPSAVVHESGLGIVSHGMTDEARDIANEVRRIIVETAKLKGRPEEIGLDQPFFGPGSLGLHSLDVFELMLELESRLEIEIKDEEIPTLNSVAAIVALVESRRRG